MSSSDDRESSTFSILCNFYTISLVLMICFDFAPDRTFTCKVRGPTNRFICSNFEYLRFFLKPVINPNHIDAESFKQEEAEVTKRL